MHALYNNNNNLQTPQDAQEYLGVDSRTMMGLRKTNRVSFKKITSRTFRYNTGELDNLLMEARVIATDDSNDPFIPHKKRIWMSSDDVCRHLSISSKTLAGLRERKKITFYKYGHKTIRYDHDDVRKFLDRSTGPATACEMAA